MTKKKKNMTKKQKKSKISPETKEEMWLGISNIAAAEEHCIEVVSKTQNKDLKKDLAKESDNMRSIRQRIVTSGVFE